jgi:MFS family permease
VTSFRENLRLLPRPAWILFGGTFVNRFGTFVMPFLVIYMTRLGYTPAQSGIAVSAYGLGHLIASTAGGHLADHIGRRYTIAISMFGSAASMIALSQAEAYAAILVCTFVVGAFGELYRPAAQALISDLVAPEQRVTAFGVYRMAINLGFAFGPATAGFLADHSFFYLFLVDAVTSFVYGIVALVALPHGLRGQTKGQAATEGIRVALRDPLFVRFLLATLCVTWIEFQIHSTLPLHIAAQGFAPRTYGLLMSLNGAMIVVFELGITAWTQRMPQQPMIAIGYGLSGIGFALTGLAYGVPALAATVVIWTIGEMIYAPVAGAFVAGIAPERYRGRYMGLWVMSWSTGMLFGPALGTLLYQSNEPVYWSTIAVMACVAAAMALSKPAQPITAP